MAVARGRRRSYSILYYHTHRSSERARQTEPCEIRTLAGVRSRRRRPKWRDEHSCGMKRRRVQPSGSTDRKSGSTFRFVVINQYKTCKRSTRLPIVTPGGGRTRFITVSTGRFPRKSRRYVQFRRVRRARVSQHLPTMKYANFFFVFEFPTFRRLAVGFLKCLFIHPELVEREHIITRRARPRRV